MLLSYLRHHLKIIILLAVFASVFALISALYGLPAEAFFYAAALCLFFGAVLFFIGYYKDSARHRRLSEMAGRITISTDGLPSPHGLPEKDYQQLIRILFDEKSRISFDADSTRSELLDYFTLWVHQIKTPIAALRLMLQADSANPQASLSVELFQIEHYVEMVLQYLRLGGNTTDFVIKTIDLDDIVRQAVRKYARLFILKKIQLDFRPGGLKVLTDEKWLCFVIEQLLGNSIKYTASGTVSIFTENASLIVEDTGIGIKPEDLPRVFDQGFTGYNGRKDKKSTGIGLYLCKRIIHMLGHTIAVSSREERGTRVTIGLEASQLAWE